jgi:hypothetical protein
MTMVLGSTPRTNPATGPGPMRATMPEIRNGGGFSRVVVTRTTSQKMDDTSTVPKPITQKRMRKISHSNAKAMMSSK